MSLVLNTNIASLNAQRNLGATQNQQATTFERLSTGLRVNSAKDDAAGLYLAQSQTKDIRGLAMATRNANDGISMAQTAEGALDQIGQNLQRINELAIQSANGTYSDAAREGLQKEVDELTQEVNRIVEVTEFNGQKLLNNEAIEAVLQIGFQNDANSRISAGMADGILDGELTAADGSRDYTWLDAAGDSQSVSLANVTGGTTDDEDTVKAYNDSVATEYEIAVDHAGEQFKVGTDLEAAIKTAITSGDVTYGQDGGTNEPITLNHNGIAISIEFDIADNGTAAEQKIENASVSAEVDGVALTNFQTALEGALNDIRADTQNELETGFDGANVDELVIDEGPLAYAAEVDVFAENALVGILDGGLDSTQTVNISTQENAQIAISQSREAIDFVSEIRATFGAVMNRFEAVVSGNQIYSENLSAARSRIQDADFAVETSNLAKQQVLQQAGISSLSQANASSQAILGLLG